MTGADIFVLYGMPVAIFAVGFAIYKVADISARRSEIRINELRRQEAENAPALEGSPAGMVEIHSRLDAVQRAVRLLVEQEEQRERRAAVQPSH
jgi:tetrahydromethanopterin S-methyltransferase subunit G